MKGRRHARRLRSGEHKRQLDDRLILGTDGITLQTPRWSSTVRFGEIRAVQAYSDGPRVLYGGAAAPSPSIRTTGKAASRSATPSTNACHRAWSCESAAREPPQSPDDMPSPTLP